MIIRPSRSGPLTMRRVLTLAWMLVWLLNLQIMHTSSSANSDDSEQRTKLINQVETNLLSLFGFARRPKVDRSQVVIPPAMLELYKKQMGHDLDTSSIAKPGIHAKSANTVRSFTHVEGPIDARFPGHHKFRLYFNLSTIPITERLKAAELTFTRQSIQWPSTDKSTDKFQHILIYDIIRPGVKQRQEAMLRLIDSKPIDTRHDGTLSVDVLPAVERWLESPKSNHGLLVKIAGFKGAQHTTPPQQHLRLRRSTSTEEQEWSNNRQPLLFTYTDDGKNKPPTESLIQRRLRRASNKHRSRKGKEQSLCRRLPLYVDFNDVGWNDWIVAPPGYNAFYCAGDCPFPLSDHMNTTNHAILQTLMNSVYPSTVPKACCVPTYLNSISMLYLDEENKVVLKNYQDMTVVGCGCR